MDKMQIKITVLDSRSNDVQEYETRVREQYVLPLKVGVVEEYPMFKILKVDGDSVTVAYKSGEHKSYGTFAKNVSDPKWSEEYLQQQTIRPGENVQASISITYLASQHEETYFLELITEQEA